MNIAGREIGPGNPPYIIADIGASHNGSLERCLELIKTAKENGADAVKFQAFLPSTITLDSDRPEFIIQDGPWKGYKLYDLYVKAHTPREWFPEMYALAKQLDIPLFPSVFSPSDVDHVLAYDPPAFKIASFEMNDILLIRYVVSLGKAVLISTGMSSEEERRFLSIEILNNMPGAAIRDISLLHCVSSYPVSINDSSLKNIKEYGGISDHSIGVEIPIAAVAMGVCIIEKHITLSRADGGLDDGFASEPHEFKAMVDAVHSIHAGMYDYKRTPSDNVHRPYRRSLFVVADIAVGEEFTPINVRSIRPGHGLPPVEIDNILGKKASCNLSAGTPMTWEYVS